MIEVVAIFVACQINMMICIVLPFLEKYHTFDDPDKCRAAIIKIINTEQEYRIKNNISYPIVMGKCKLYLNKNR